MTNFLVSKVVKNKQKEEKENKRIDHRRKSKSKKTLEENEKDGKGADDFILDDEGRPIGEKCQKKSPIFSAAALQESPDGFCVNFDYYKLRIYTDEDYEEDEGDALVEDEINHRQELKTFDKKGSEGDYFDASDFIVNNEDRPIAGKRPKKSLTCSNDPLQEAQDIFCANFDYHRF